MTNIMKGRERWGFLCNDVHALNKCTKATVFGKICFDHHRNQLLSVCSSTMASDLTISTRCYIKILMHALKYPHATVNGVLLAEKKKAKDGEGNNRYEFVDVVPLFHLGHGLTPMIEVALLQVYIQFWSSFITLTISQNYPDRRASNSSDVTLTSYMHVHLYCLY